MQSESQSGARPYLIGQLVGTLLHVRELIAHVCVICHGCWGGAGGADLQLGRVDSTGSLRRAGRAWNRDREETHEFDASHQRTALGEDLCTSGSDLKASSDPFPSKIYPPSQH